MSDSARRKKVRARARALAPVVVVVAVQLLLMASVFHPAPHAGGDNAGYVALGYSLAESGQYVELWDPEEPPHTKYPPVFPAILAGAMLLGARSWVALKVVTGAFVTCSVLLSFLWVRERRGILMAGAVAGVLAIASSLLGSTHWVLSDPPFLAFTMLALWALQREEREDVGQVWLVIGGVAAILAYFTRSAGFPLILAVAAWLVLAKRWRALATFCLAFGAPSLLWWIRGRAVVGSSYLGEFSLIDPYVPDLGRVGMGALLLRIWENLRLYAGDYFLSGIIGYSGTVVGLLAMLFTGAAAWGWFRRVRTRATVAEFFVPLYMGLLLLWPPIWSGDRLALPLYALLLFYAGETLLQVVGRLGKRVATAVVVLVLVSFAIPAGMSWREAVREAASCTADVRLLGDFGCYGPRWYEYGSAAEWSRRNLPDGAAIFTRKPRFFYVSAGVPGRTVPLSADPEVFRTQAEEFGIRYALIDYIDPLTSHYLVPAVMDRLQGFCSMQGWGPSGEVRTEMLGFMPAEVWDASSSEDEDGTLVVDLISCPQSFLRRVQRASSAYSQRTIPLLEKLDR